MLSDFSAFVHYLKRYCFNLSRTLIYLTAQADTGIAEHGPCPRVSDRDPPRILGRVERSWDWDVARAYLCIVEPRYINTPILVCFCSCIPFAVNVLIVDGSREKLLCLDGQHLAPLGWLISRSRVR